MVKNKELTYCLVCKKFTNDYIKDAETLKTKY